MKRNLKEAASTIEAAISKCLCGARLYPSEIEEMSSITYADLMTEHGLDSLMAEKVVTHLNLEKLRQNSQSLQTWQVDSREAAPHPKSAPSPTNPIRESVDLLEDFALEDIMSLDVPEEHAPEGDADEGRMLDYGHVKSDSREGKMMRQALYEISEYSKGLHDLLTDEDDLPQWCHYKVAVARACVGKVAHYLKYKIKRHEEK